MNGPTYEYISGLLSYNSEAGEFLSLRTGKRKASYRRSGYVLIDLCNVAFSAHRLAWLLTHREWPSGNLDHINGDKADNRISNLRIASVAQNAQNRPVRTRYLSKCIYLENSKKKRIKKFLVRVQANGKRHHIGRFRTEEEAKVAAVSAIKRLHGKFTHSQVV